jgi:hypothetical protein
VAAIALPAAMTSGASPADAATRTCGSHTKTAYAYRYDVSNPSNRYARVSMTIAWCAQRTSSGGYRLTSASCTVERAAMRSKTTLDGSMAKRQLGGKGTDRFLCDASQGWKLDRTFPIRDQRARPAVHVAWNNGRITYSVAEHGVFQ